jgi:hypothetical protein
MTTTYESYSSYMLDLVRKRWPTASLTQCGQLCDALARSDNYPRRTLHHIRKS